ncbi:tol-pal system protein YbgF [Stutzerimonas tarimensis]|uniref:Cell division coordinator CpoB n=1 Tax=Stutzerimonas tarimensis TaxID=1507735 RepID=A0ABV7T6X5_9GAMM
MQKHRFILTLFTLSLSGLALAQAPIMDSSQVENLNRPQVQAPDQRDGGAFAEGGVSTPPSAQGMLFMQLQQMQEEITALRGMVEEQQNHIQRLEREGLERYQDLDRRLSSGPAAGAMSQPDSRGAGAAGATPEAAAAPVGNNAQPGDPANEKLYYDAAFDLIKSKDFDKASQAFTAFLRRYPDSQFAGNAQYWLGEVNLAQGDLQAAGQAFARVSQAYPDHSKVPDSLFKLADVELRLGNRDRAQGIFREVIAKYPNTSAAQLSQRQLDR